MSTVKNNKLTKAISNICFLLENEKNPFDGLKKYNSIRLYTGEVITGANLLFLGSFMKLKGIRDPRFLKFLNVSSMGAIVATGAKGVPIIESGFYNKKLKRMATLDELYKYKKSIVSGNENTEIIEFTNLLYLFNVEFLKPRPKINKDDEIYYGFNQSRERLAEILIFFTEKYPKIAADLKNINESPRDIDIIYTSLEYFIRKIADLIVDKINLENKDKVNKSLYNEITVNFIKYLLNIKYDYSEDIYENFFKEWGKIIELYPEYFITTSNKIYDIVSEISFEFESK